MSSMVGGLTVTGWCSRSSRAARVLALVSSILLLGVSAGWSKESGNNRKNNGREQVERVLEELVARRSTVQTVGVRLNLTLYDCDKNKETPLVGAYIGDKDGNMRLRITAVTNQLVLDMGRHGDKVEVYLPRKDRFFSGNPKDLLNHQSQLTLLAHIGNALDLFFPCASTPASVGRTITCNDSRKIVSVLEKPNYIRHRARRLTLAPNLPVVEDMEVYDRYGREVGVVKYRDYVFPEWGAEIATSGPLVPGDPPEPPHPGRIALCPYGIPHSLVMQVEEFILNEAITPSRFDVPRPEDQKVQDLGRALKKSGNLWD
jgi:hypothetical protein